MQIVLLQLAYRLSVDDCVNLQYDKLVSISVFLGFDVVVCMSVVVSVVIKSLRFE